MSENRDEDSLKIQIISERCHTLFNAKSSFIFAGLIAFMVLFYTLYYQHTFSSLVFGVALSGLVAGCIVLILRISKEYNSSITKISAMIEKVELGEKLPSLKQLVNSDNESKNQKNQKIKSVQAETNDNNDAWKKRLNSLIDKVDNNCKRKRLYKEWLGLLIWICGMFVLVILILMWYNLQDMFLKILGELPQDIEGAKFMSEQVSSLSAFSVSGIAAAFAILALFLGLPRTTNKELANWYYKKLSKSYENADKVYLKALIRMKCNNFDIPLKQVYEESVRINSDILSEKYLLKSLYWEDD